MYEYNMTFIRHVFRVAYKFIICIWLHWQSVLTIFLIYSNYKYLLGLVNFN